ncbi:MAG: CapA family protein [Patescibacteria group bacterium]
MRQKIKNLIEIILISLISLSIIFGVFKIARAPLGEFIESLAQRENTIRDNDARLPTVPTVPEKAPVVFIFGGDVMLSRQVNSRMVKYDNYSWPLAKIANFLKTADLTIINLESPFLLTDDYYVPTGSFSFKADPQAISGLIAAGIDIVSLANNHALNQGVRGLSDTFRILSDNGIKYIGAGNNEAEARQGEIIAINDDKFGFLAYAYLNDASLAGENSSGIVNMDIEKMQADVARLKKLGAEVILNMHAGIEYVTEPNQQQIDFAHAAIDAGAAAVIGHHPHWPQTFEIYQGRPIIYSLGNLVFDQMWSEETRQGLLAKMTWRDDWEEIELIPIKIYDYGQAEIITDKAERKIILEKIGAPENGMILME